MAVDRFSNLPDKIAEAVLCTLPGEDIIRLSFASKRWRELCLRIPFLTFEHGFDLSNFVFSFDSTFDQQSCINRVTCVDSTFDQQSWINRVTCVDSFMNLRYSDGTQIRSFNLSWLYNGRIASYFNKWLFQAVACEVEAINLDILPINIEGHTNIKLLPLDLLPLFNSKTLKKLVVNLRLKRTSLNRLPSLAIHLNSLEYLKLQHVCFCSDHPYYQIDLGGRRVSSSFDVGGMVSSSCKCLKELYLVHCYGFKLSINSSSLQLFHLYYSKPPPRNGVDPILYELHISAKNLQELDIVWYPPSNMPCLLEICTPNLQVLNWTGHPTGRYWCVKKLAHLEQARLNFMDFTRPRGFRNLSLSNSAIGQVVRSIGNITGLQPLCLQSVVVLAQGNAIPFMFHRLKTLVLVSNGLGASEVGPLRSLLMGAPNLMEFKLTSHGLAPEYNPFSDPLEAPQLVASPASYDVKYWECGLQFVRQLKILTIELYKGPFVLELFKFLLKNAQVLEKVVVYYSPPSFPQEAAAITAEFKKDSTSLRICTI